MSVEKFFKITKEAINLYLKGLLNEERLLNLINVIRLEKEIKDEYVYQETLLIKKLFEIKRYYEIEIFIEEFSNFLNNMSYKRKGDIILINGILQSIKDKIHYRVSTNVDIHIYALLKLNYIESLNQKNISIIFKNSDLNDSIIGLNVASNYAYKQMNFISLLNNEVLSEEVAKEIVAIKESIQKNIMSLIRNYYDIKSLKDFITNLNNTIKSIKLEKNQRNELLYLINLKMSYYTKKARKSWKKKKAKTKTYTLPLVLK